LDFSLSHECGGDKIRFLPRIEALRVIAMPASARLASMRVAGARFVNAV